MTVLLIHNGKAPIAPRLEGNKVIYFSTNVLKMFRNVKKYVTLSLRLEL